MSADIETYIRQKCPWSKLPRSVKQVLGDSQKEYEKLVVHFSVKNQLRFRGNLARAMPVIHSNDMIKPSHNLKFEILHQSDNLTDSYIAKPSNFMLGYLVSKSINFLEKNLMGFRSVKKDERGYYEELLRYSREHLMLYPYHLSDFIVTGMRITPFQYYITIMQDLMEQEKSYDALPNFTAADCLRLLGIGRNQYIELMNQCRSSKKFFGVRRKPVRELLPPKPVSTLQIEPWWLVYVGYVTEDDIKVISDSEKVIIDKIIDDGVQKAGNLDAKDVKGLYRRGLIYLDVPIDDDDCVCVPPLEGFVMNRVLGDYLEKLLYKIFVSIDEHTTVAELANILLVDLELVKNAVSMYCRLGFAKKKGQDEFSHFHSSWRKQLLNLRKTVSEDEYDNLIQLLDPETSSLGTVSESESVDQVPAVLSTIPSKRIGFLFDSTLTAFLMMGNLSPGLKSHAVTMFEVGKLSDESLDSFLVELLKVADVGEGEARRYFDHALTLRDTIVFLRHNPHLISDNDGIVSSPVGLGLDLLRCESLQNLDQETCSRLLNKNYCLLISMAPLTNEIRPVSSCSPPHLGPPIPEVSSVWFKLFLYSLTKCGPPSLLLTKGTRLRVLPKIFRDHEKLLVTTWAHDPSTVQMSNALPILNDALCHSAVLVQGQGFVADFYYVPFPLCSSTNSENDSSGKTSFENHRAIQVLSKELDLKHNSGYITMMKTSQSQTYKPSRSGSLNLKKVLEDTTIHSTKGTSDKNAEKKNVCNESTFNFTDGNDESCETEPFQESDWLLLDCSFGIPLFEGSLNKKVCQRLLDERLCNSISLKNLIASSRKLCLQILEFISKNQPVISSIDSGRNISFQPNRPGYDSELPLPSVNLIFCDGELSVWDQFSHR